MTETRLPMVTGPITGGRRGRPFGSAFRDLAAAGYVEEEYFIEGRAARYRLAGGADPAFDGRWDVEETGILPYRTRLLVRRPTDPERFNGTVMVIWQNVSAGWDFLYGETPELIEGGYAVVGVSAQRAGVHGDERGEGLVSWDPDRYGGLVLPSVDIGYDVFTQAGRVLGPDRPRAGVDPMGGLAVERLVATGPSQPANRLVTYVNALQAREHLYDGFVIERYLIAGMALENPDDNENVIYPEGSHLIRTDTGARIFVVNPESDVVRTYGCRQPDSEWYRLWEVAGVSHVGTWSTGAWRAKYERDFERPFERPSHGPLQNNLSMLPVIDAAFHHMHVWASGGPPPPAQPRIVMGGDPPAIQRDSRGVALGGVRLPQVEVPTSIHIGTISPEEPNLRGLRGHSIPLEPEQLAELYPDHQTYLSRFIEATRAAEAAGVLLGRDAESLIAEAAAAPVPPPPGTPEASQAGAVLSG